MLLNLAWSDFKVQLNNGVPFRAASVGGVYYLVAGLDVFEFNCLIPQNGSADQTDYETHYASSAVNYSISPLSPGTYRNITGNTNVTVKSTAGVLMAILVNNNSTDGIVTVYDNTTNSGTKIGTIQAGSPSGGLLSTNGVLGPGGYIAMNVKFLTGLTVVTSGSSNNDITIIYR